MRHQIFEDRAFYSLRTPAWRRLGFVAPEPMTLPQILAATDTDYAYEFAPVTTTVLTDNGVTTLEAPDKRAVIRRHKITDARSYVGIVGNTFKLHTSQMMNSTVNALLSAGVSIETYGLLGDRGQRMFLTFKLPAHITVGGKDAINSYLFASTAFDGSRSTEFRTTTVRVVCANTFAHAERNSQTTARIRHTSLMEGKVQAVREMLELAYEQADEMQTLADSLLATTMRREDIDTFLKVTFPIPQDSKTTRGETIALNKRAAVKDLLNSPTNAPYADTAWGAFNAFTEYLDHEARAKDDGLRLSRIIDGDAESLKSSAARLLLAGV